MLENVVTKFPTCGVVGQLDLPDVVIGETSVSKEEYLHLFKEAFKYGGMCSK